MNHLAAYHAQPYLGLFAIGSVVLLALILRFIDRKRHPVLITEQDHRVEMKGDIITHHLPDAPPESIALSALQRVLVETNDEGPFEGGVFFVLVAVPTAGTTGRCYIPDKTPGLEEMLDELYALPGFDTALFHAARSSGSGQVFDVWAREPACEPQEQSV